MAAQKIIIACGSPAAGKTSIMTHYIKSEIEQGKRVCAAKIDCLSSKDDMVYKNLGIPTVLGLSNDICPDHFLAVNLEEIVQWSAIKNADTLVIETAGLCHRCAPATDKTIAVCVLDCVTSIKVPEKIGPILTTCDIMLITKSDMVSQAETEVFYHNAKKLNERADIIEVNGITGAGVQYLQAIIDKIPPIESITGDNLRYSMPSAICSYCVGEKRIGNAFQKGIVTKMRCDDV
ncbi:MAG: hypothetical protein FWD47_13625 [Treponema sp.]|nr:hypothetical protein [Treponema sp.]